MATVSLLFVFFIHYQAWKKLHSSLSMVVKFSKTNLKSVPEMKNYARNLYNGLLE